ncbi:MAG: hypothetical protein II969_13365 [Anaerolineaceae bacterium]|nr:hypothetical protein [Anaerolineaceae bacterium]
MNNKKRIAIFIFIFSCFFSAVCSAQNTHGGHLYFDDTRKNVGVYLDELSDLQLFRNTPDILGWFENWYGPSAEEKLRFCASTKSMIPMITWQPMYVPLREIADGYHDAYIINWLQTLTTEAPDIDILVRFAHEMEFRPSYTTLWFTWLAEKDPEAYIAAWRHIVTLSREINPNIKWVWAPNMADVYTDPYYPGEEYVDYVGITVNLRESVTNYSYYHSFADYYNIKTGNRTEDRKNLLETYEKKIIISEAAYSNPDTETKRQYLKSIFDYLLEDPMITAVVFFNTDKKNPGEQFNFTNKEKLVEEFNQDFERVLEVRSKK